MAKQKQDGISWTDETWSPIVGCSRISYGCAHCWAVGQAHLHYNLGEVYDHEGLVTTKKTPGNKVDWTGKVIFFPERLGWPNHIKEPKRIAVCLMGDIFHPSVPFAYLDQIWATMGCCEAPDLRNLTFQILTKRPGQMLSYAKYRAESGMVFDLPNLWVGVSIEDQITADERIRILLQTPAAVRWISYEPALGPVEATPYLDPFSGLDPMLNKMPKINWVVAGGESGHGSRPAHPDWFRSIRNQCLSAGVAFHFKGWGDWTTNKEVTPTHIIFENGELIPVDASIQHKTGRTEPYWVARVGKKSAGRLLDGREWLEFPGAA